MVTRGLQFVSPALAAGLLVACAGMSSLSPGVCQDDDYDPSIPGEDTCVVRSEPDGIYLAGETQSVAFEFYAEGSNAGSFTATAEAQDERGPIDVVVEPAQFELDGEIQEIVVLSDVPPDACGSVLVSLTVTNDGKPNLVSFAQTGGSVYDGDDMVACP